MTVITVKTTAPAKIRVPADRRTEKSALYGAGSFRDNMALIRREIVETP